MRKILHYNAGLFILYKDSTLRYKTNVNQASNMSLVTKTDTAYIVQNLEVRISVDEAARQLNRVRTAVYNYIGRGYLTLHEDEKGKTYLLLSEVLDFQRNGYK